MRKLLLIALLLVGLGARPLHAQTNVAAMQNLPANITGPWIFTNPPAFPPSTVAGLPAPNVTQVNAVAIVMDGSGSTPCTTGGGSEQAWCRNTGSAWTLVGFTSGGGGGLYDSGHSYNIGDGASYGGNPYVSLTDGNEGHTPLSQFNGGTYNSLNYWQSTLPFPPPFEDSLANGPLVQYVAPAGNDANDGRSLGTAKATWGAACEALYTGNSNVSGVHYCGTGTIYIQNNIWANANHGFGIQLMGNGGDPNYPYNGTAWEMLQGAIQTICIGGESSNSNGSPGCLIQGGSAADIWHPGLWITASDVSLEWHGLQLQDQGRNVLISVCSDHSEQSNGECGASSINFYGPQTAVSQTSTNGPGWCIDTNTLWVHVYEYSIAGNPYMAAGGVTADNAAAVLMGSCNPEIPNPSATNGGIGDVNFYSGIVKGGGFKIWSGNQGDATSTIENLTSENALEAMVWFAGPSGGGWSVGGLKQLADCDGGDCAGVRTDAGVIPVYSSAVGKFIGQVEPLGFSSPTGSLGNPTTQPTNTNMFGYISPYKIRAQSDAAAREFPAVIAVGSPLISSTMAGNVTACGTCTITTGEADPAGGTNAIQISDTSSGGESHMNATGDGGAVVGDSFGVSIWYKPVTGNCCNNGGGAVFRLFAGGDDCASSGDTFLALPPYSNSPSYQHYIGICKLSFYASGGAPNFSFETTSTSTMQYFNPQIILFHGYTDDEIAEKMNNLGTWSSTCTPGQLCNLNGPVSGGAFSTQSSAYTLKVSDSWVNVTGTTTIKAPHAIAGQTWTVFNSGSNTVTLEADSGNFNGTASVTLSANAGMSVTCDGANCFGH